MVSLDLPMALLAHRKAADTLDFVVTQHHHRTETKGLRWHENDRYTTEGITSRPHYEPVKQYGAC